MTFAEGRAYDEETTAASELHLRVLLIDDDPDDARIIGWHLKRMKGIQCDLTLHHDPFEGQEALRSGRFDLCLLDFHMGNTNGLAVLRAAMSSGCETPVVMLTGATEEEVDLQALAAGATDYIEKQSVDPQRLARTLRYTHERHQAAMALKRSEARLSRAYEQLANNHRDLQALLNQMAVGCALTDAAGCLSFVSDAAAELFETAPQPLIGQPLSSLPGLSSQAQRQIETLMQKPAEERARVAVEIKGQAGGRYAVEIDVLDDPRDLAQRMLFFYDVTEIRTLKRQLGEQHSFHELIGRCAAMTELFQLIRDVARFDITVLIEGETGTGKELVARAIHASSNRQHRPFVAVNCAGLTDSLLASQLFGHRRGAFTGAVEDHKGLFEAAEGGTLFLDEIGDIPHKVQTTLLRVLQEREITRLGETTPRPVNVRVIAATHRDLTREVDEGRFRADLLYRIRIMQLQLPPLRERKEDIALLANNFIEVFGTHAGVPIPPLTQRAVSRLLGHDWPGNVRELKAAMEYAMIRSRGRAIEPIHLPPELSATTQLRPAAPLLPEQDEKARIVDALKRAGGNRTQAARLLGISRATFYRRLESLDIDI